ncbi:MAG: Asp-tRNA(Asn)/Glu-tRNA(Gln) amidotransferase subunit GatB [Anaerolineales bacterium]|nr:MAG: Asp-tRNA(Asn)/Glu-tRNA(Gln) amidotransferase subunit GatB [Anaerolineales bacterium]
MVYEPVIGMEVHVELSTASKMFCGCSARAFGTPPNTHVCPVCLGMPGTLPVINEQAVRYTVMTGLALNCAIQEHNVFARKNYFYPDLPKGYQISQYELPLCKAGFLEIEVDETFTGEGSGGTRSVGIRRVHLEEDTGKLTHVDGHSLVDFNRAGVPLMEIVSEADIRSAAEAYTFVTQLRQIVRYLGVSSGDMEKGAMRCEVNLSLRPAGSDEFGTKVEVKNLNSFRSVRNAIDYEIKRQTRLLEAGQPVVQVTMGWDEATGVTREQRSKEEAHDYRYFPEPDLPPLSLEPAWIEGVKASLSELPQAKRDRFMTEYGLSRYDAGVLVEDPAIADYFERALQVAGDAISPKSLANWVTGELFRLINEIGITIGDVKVRPEDLVALLKMLSAGAINQTAAKKAFSEMWETGRPPQEIIQERGLRQISDASQLAGVVAEVIGDNPDAVASFREGKDTIIRFMIGQVMKATRGKANPQLVERLLREQLQPDD